MKTTTRSLSLGHSLPLLLGLCASLIAAPSLAQNYPYIIEDLGAPPFNGPVGESRGWAINNLGQVAVTFATPDVAHLGIYKDGVGIVDLGKPGDDRNGLTPVGINDNGQIAVTLNPEFTPHAYLYDPQQGYINAQIDVALGMNRYGTMVGLGEYPNGLGAGFENLFIGGGVRNLDFPFSQQNPVRWFLQSARAISADGAIAGTGFRHDPPDYFSGTFAAWILDGGEIQDLGTLGGYTTIPYGINSRHQVIGSSETGALYNNAIHAFLWQNTVMSDLGLLPDMSTAAAKAINENGEVVGAMSGNGNIKFFYYHPGGGLSDISTLIDPAEGWNFNTVFADVTGINDRGQICGYTARIVNGVGELHAFRMTPRSALCQDVSSRVQVSRSGFRLNRANSHFVQTVTIKNISTSPIIGPISLALDNLSANATLTASAGVTHFLLPAGSPYASVSDANLAPGASVSFTLEFADPSLAAIGYSTRVLAGYGMR